MSKKEQLIFFVLGNNPELSIAEVLSQFNKQKIDYSVVSRSYGILLCQVSQLPEDFFSDLGGIKKFGTILNDSSQLEWKIIEHILQSFKEDKFIFGFSFYNFSAQEIGSNRNIFKRGAIEFKKQNKSRFSKIRYVETKDNELSSVILSKEKVLHQGMDVVIIKAMDKVYYGKTIKAQDYDAFSRRDFGKPMRDEESGMLPPKLARMMINLSGADKDQLIIDPFCGSGTVILEMLSLGFKSIAGSDISSKAVTDTKKNIDWWRKNNNSNINPTIGLYSSTDIDKYFNLSSVDAIVTEPFLGPPIRGRVDTRKILKTVSELEALYLNSFKKFNKILKPTGTVVMVWPVFVYKNQKKFIDLIPQIEKLGFIRLYYPDSQLDDIDNRRRSYLYHRVGQIIHREIIVWQKAIAE